MRPSNLRFFKLELECSSSFNDARHLLDLPSIPTFFSLPFTHSSQAATFILDNRELFPIVFEPFNQG
jgi:hypothetical protein